MSDARFRTEGLKNRFRFKLRRASSWFGHRRFLSVRASLFHNLGLDSGPNSEWQDTLLNKNEKSPENQEDDDNRCYLFDTFYSEFFFFTTGGLRWSACMGRCGQWQSSCVMRYLPKRFTKHGYFMIQLGQCCHSPIMAVPR